MKQKKKKKIIWIGELNTYQAPVPLSPCPPQLLSVIFF